MSGIYIHTPFCKQKCYYCDFFSSTQLDYKDSYINALLIEIEERKEELGDEIQTIYFGGGTPSLLSLSDVETILRKLEDIYSFDGVKELSLEANPEQINKDYLRGLIVNGINKISIGVQSFDNNDLREIGRMHSAEEAIRAVEIANEVGFRNISIDLIYNLPKTNMDKLRYNLEIAASLDIQHISAYTLVVEEGTRFMELYNKGELELPSEEEELMEFNYLIDFLADNGIYQYELSNFARPGFESIHNSNYWNNKKYLGLGPGAHSFDGRNRRWNKPSVEEYIESLIKGSKSYFETERLSPVDKYNEYIILNARRVIGFNLEHIESRFDKEMLNHFRKESSRMIREGYLRKKDNSLVPTRKGLELNNQLILEMMI